MILPRDDFVVTSRANRIELQARLQGVVAPPLTLKGFFSRKRQAGFESGPPLFTGEVLADRFRIVRHIYYRNSFNPMITGAIEDGRVSVRQRLHPLVLAFMAFWVTSVGSTALMFTFVAFEERSVGAVQVVPVAMLVFGIALPHAAFRLEARRNRKHLQELLA